MWGWNCRKGKVSAGVVERDKILHPGAWAVVADRGDVDNSVLFALRMSKRDNL